MNTTAAISTGMASRCRLQPTPYQAIRPNMTTDAMPKSISPAPTEDRGMIRRGKYTLLMSCCCPTSDVAELEMAPAKKVHGNRAAYTNTGYGRPSDGIFANLPNTSVNSSMVATGWISAQATPSTVCL